MSVSIRTLEGNLIVPQEARFAIAASRFNHLVVDRLIEGAQDALVRHGAKAENITLVRLPGLFEMPIPLQRLAQSQKFDAIIALGCAIRGSTSHFDLISHEVTKSIAHITLSTGIPILFGILTTETIEQAAERAGTKMGNKGWEAALAAIEMANLNQILTDQGL
ncbi:6,7-dimethyl-8-ribityllumazine synthase [Pajaroellobacter abortibovis]|uniref:6,7-dimethyl-8-ribityllumazine synthase n=1 Tax=Pajaroellobacter abortibovis TaxID=1882918 RepID=A0A1L6MVG3_9BACT|nr:6,7-dimethyl-8-ribityllumazine synthase [Pajaroellobacter abortibovis]APR99529.1 6,7-dimethyl-8-ribityllumazine synthase [Pajaroellobacter abortibovis]